MSANLDLVRSIYADWEHGDFSTADWAHPDIEYVVADGPEPGTWSGVGEMAAAFRDLLGAWEDFRVRADEYREVDEGAVAVPVPDERCHLAVVDVEEDGGLRPHLSQLKSASLAMSTATGEHEDALVVELPVLVSLGTELLPAAHNSPPSGGHALKPPGTPAIGSIGDYVLDLGVGPVRSAEVPAFPVRVDRAHEVEVRGHSPTAPARPL